jgi:hypothetical protein
MQRTISAVDKTQSGFIIAWALQIENGTTMLHEFLQPWKLELIPSGTP